MRGIILKESVELFGFKDGFGFWFRWSFVSPIQEWIWLNITRKEYCLYSGWHCEKENCQHKHLKTKEKILKEFEKHKKEAETIKAGPKGECAYCNEEPGTEIIDDPNWDTLERWKVCKTCKEVISIEHELNMLTRMLTKENENRIFKLNNRLLEIEKTTGKKILRMGFTVDDKGIYRIET